MLTFKLSQMKTSLSQLLSGRFILLLILLQVAIWYLLILDVHEDWQQSQRKLTRIWKSWQNIQQQDALLQTMQNEQWPWLSMTSINSRNQLITGWRIEGVASLTEWQPVLESLQERFALSVIGIKWQRRQDAQWVGVVDVDIEPPAPNREWQNWLPSRFQKSVFHEEDWHLSSTMKVQDRCSALVQYRQRHYWLTEGSWIPDASVSVSKVAVDYVILVAKDGKQYRLERQTRRSLDDDYQQQEVAH
ncbi:hypothetical protein [Marinomonas sp. THO17]|uniref:hypothetical protein n=1 Tax=Marinomonas sp. THO17 TaxID=3149048 RepID=UPI00336BDB5C